ncbi:winged helix DNA-binding domain-containing protein [Yinghuangia sp. YIM S09857]|uniref:winged helix DNA-binding domain-containing protein n=1 Tax=Yinghuangia sp. YIM S09857 TaxID=3436929 RepID=UPI003F532567
MPSLTHAQVCAARFSAQGLGIPMTGDRPAALVPVAVAVMAGTHAQVMSAAELGIGLRVQGATRQDVRKALWQDHTIVKTYGPRGTVHFLPANELPHWIGALSSVPPLASNAFPEGARMTADQTEAVIAAIADALKGADLTIDELSDAVVERAGDWAGDLVMPAFQTMWPRWRQVQHLAGLRGVLAFGPNRGRKVTYTNPHRLNPFEPADAGEAVGYILRSYLTSYGPSTPQRFAHWLAAPKTWAAGVFAAQGDSIRPVEVEGTKAWLPADHELARRTGDTPQMDVPPAEHLGVRLLPYFDAYSYRVGNQPPELLYPGKAADRVLPGNFQNLIVDGVVAGLWHLRRSGRRLLITVESAATLTRRRRAELDEQVDRVGVVLEGRPELTMGPVTVGGHA